jgi:hypothetical protein
MLATVSTDLALPSPASLEELVQTVTPLFTVASLYSNSYNPSPPVERL